MVYRSGLHQKGIWVPCRSKARKYEMAACRLKIIGLKKLIKLKVPSVLPRAFDILFCQPQRILALFDKNLL